MTVFLHSGSSKAGSTAIQNALNLNSDSILASGFTLPEFVTSAGLVVNSNLACLIAFGLPQKIASNSRIVALNIDAAAERPRFRQEITRCTWEPDRHCVLSAECIDTFQNAQLEEVKGVIAANEEDIENVHYLRPPYSLLCSVISFLVRKGGPFETPKGFLGTCIRSNYVSRVRDVLPKTEFYSYAHVKKTGHGVPGHFFDRVFGHEAFDFSAKRSNAGLSNAATRLLGVLNHRNSELREGSADDLRGLKEDCLKIKQLRGDKFRLSSSEFREIEPFLREENEKLAGFLGSDFTDAEFPLISYGGCFGDTDLEAMEKLWPELTAPTRDHLSSRFALSF